MFPVLPAVTAATRAKEAALRAIALDDGIGEAHGSLGLVYLWFEYDWPAAERETRRGVEVDPNSALAHQEYGMYLTSTGRHEAAIAEGSIALELDPRTPLVQENACWFFYNARHYDRAIEHCLKAIDLDRDFHSAWGGLGRAYAQKG